VRAPAPAPAPAADPAEAERAAAQYERELRERLSSEREPPPSFLHRHRRLVLAGTLAVALGAAAGVFLLVSARNAARAAAGAATKGRAGLARDTLASLREAQRLLAEARGRSRDPEVGALAAEVSAILAVEHGDEPARAAARALVDSGAAGDGAIAVEWLLADGEAARAGPEKAILAARPSQGALLQALAGRILVSRGELEGGRGRLEIAARANPPLLRALSDLGDLSLAAGDAEGALAFYGAALAAHATHPRSAIGAAEARLALGRELEVSRRELDAIDADAGSAPPRDVRGRFEIARARVLAALGEAPAAVARLAHVAERDGEPASLTAALAEIHLQARAFPQAEAAAVRAVARDPADPDHRVLLARARIGRGRFNGALQATEGFDGRAVRIQRAIARYRLGQWAEARAELERTGHDGKLPAEAAVWFALVDVASGKADRALPLLERLVQAVPPPPLASFARGRALEALGRPGEAEAAYRAAADREPLAPEGHAALGRLLLATGRARDAVAPLERAARLDPSDLATRRALGEARLAAGQPSAARGDLDFVLLAAPRDAAALRALSAAWLAEGQPQEARLAADRAGAAAPRDPAALLAAARAASAAGDAAAARKLGARALKAGATGRDRDEARRLAAGMVPRKR
jgi:Tfp pilus assembly protein PilF